MTHTNRVRLSKLSLGLIVALAAAPVFAQSTSAGLGGRVVGADGQPVAGAEVTITHTESGTVSRATTDGNGNYSARGLRVGGPYTITVNKAGAGSAAENNVFLGLDKVSQVNTQLKNDVATLESVTVVGAAASVFSPNKMGTGSNVTRDQIEAFPSIERNLQDYARLDPRVAQTDKARNEISVGGQNPRYNAIRVDGISTNDAFGLESNGLPTPKQPFSMDTIDEIAVDVANYDVTISGGVGGVINAVTKSGTNEFHGSIYGLYRDNDMVRKNENGSKFTGFEDEKTYGLTVGGPLIKDKLFFFFNYEKFDQGAPGPNFGPIGSGASNIVDISPEDIAAVQAASRAKGFDSGGYAVSGADTTSEEYGLKIDWNITDSQRFSFRYGTSDQSVAVFPDFFPDMLPLSTHSYQRDYEFDSYTAQLFSDWTDNFSTEAKVSYRDYTAVRTPTADLPEIEIDFDGNSVIFGTEENTHANILETQTWNAFFAGNLFLGDHTVKFGFDYEDNDIYNLFGRRTNGVYVFDSLEDYQNNISSSYRLFYPTGGNLDNMAAVWGMQNLGLFVQDSWTVNDNLTLTFGLRYDTPMLDDKPTHNAVASQTFGFDNSATIDGNSLFQPRFGFNYTFDSDRMAQFRGGLGLFQGAAANVWLSNPFTNTGLGYIDYNLFDGITGFSPDPRNQIGLIPPGQEGGTQSIDFVDPELGQPAVWKANLAFDHELPWFGIIGSAEMVFTQVKEAIFYQQLNLGAPTAVGQDGRLIYWDAVGLNPASWTASGGQPSGVRVRSRTNANSDFTDAIIARPTDKGSSQQFTVSLQKPFGEGDWYWQAAYTFTDAKEVSPLTSSTSGSQWGNINTFNPNEENVARSSYEIRHRFTGALSWRHAFFGDNNTTVSLFFESRTGRPYSYVYDNDANGDGRFGNDLLYVPTGPGDVVFNNAAEEAAFWAFVNGNEDLSKAKGSVVSRNSARAPWVNQFDLRISQEVPGFWEGHKAELWVDLLNVGNLIDKDWGQIEEIPFPLSRGVVEYGGIDAATGKYVYRYNGADKLSLYDERAISRWALQIGFRYKF